MGQQLGQNQNQNQKLISAVAMVVMVGFFVACGPKGSNGGSPNNGGRTDTNGGRTDTKPKIDVERKSPTHELVISDLEDLSAPQVNTGAVAYDLEHRQIFSKIFGGQSKAAVSKFVLERVKYFVTQEELDKDWRMSPSDFKNDGWMRSPAEPPQKNKDKDKGKNKGSGGSGGGGGKLVVTAANIGTLYWYMGALDKVRVILRRGNQDIPVDSPRVGLMKFGEGYTKDVKVTAKNGAVTTYVLPHEYRQETLVHEARHSDCSGGTTETDLDVARRATNLIEFITKYQKISCGHLHSPCPAGHQYAGMLVCDRHPWGAYAIGAIYASAMKRAAQPGSVDQQIMQMVAIDSWNRVSVGEQETLGGSFGLPELNSSGVRAE